MTKEPEKMIIKNPHGNIDRKLEGLYMKKAAIDQAIRSLEEYRCETLAATEKGPSSSKKRRKTILVVDDDVSVLTLVGSILKRQGYQVLVADWAESALRHAEAEQEIDLAVIDVWMPYMPGTDLAERLLSLRPNLPVLFMSGFHEDEMLRVSVLEHGLGFLQKPFQAEGLISIVRQALAQSSHASNNVTEIAMTAGG